MLSYNWRQLNFFGSKFSTFVLVQEKFTEFIDNKNVATSQASVSK